MGLDVTAYRGLRPAVPQCSGEIFTASVVEEEFKSRADSIADESQWNFAESFSFHAGSYGGYNDWREKLAQLAGFGSAENAWKSPPGRAFWSLINFSDCQGVIGPQTSAALARDFQEAQSRADEHPDLYFREIYGRFRRAFQLAADNGAVSFH